MYVLYSFVYAGNHDLSFCDKEFMFLYNIW
jgi:hypothetical protein